jgi:hypothetical protein
VPIESVLPKEYEVEEVYKESKEPQVVLDSVVDVLEPGLFDLGVGALPVAPLMAYPRP